MITVAINGVLLMREWNSFALAIAYLDTLTLRDERIILTNIQTGTSHVFKGEDFNA